MITVRDEGLGLTAGDLSRLFGRFTRLSARPMGQEASTGLGLYLVRQMTHLRRGRVWAESAGPGQGATSLVTLPVSAAAAPTRAPGRLGPASFQPQQ